MTPQPGNIITLFFRNNVQLEGEVAEWSDTIAILKSPTGASTIVVQNTKADLLFYKVSNVKTEYEQAKNKPIKTEDISKIAALKNELNDIERTELKEKLNTHLPNGMRTTNYGLPFPNNTIKSTIEHPREKVTRESFGIGAGLQNLFQKKH